MPSNKTSPVSFVAIVQETKPFAVDMGDFGSLEGEYRPGKVNSDLLEAVMNVNPRYTDGLHRQIVRLVLPAQTPGQRQDQQQMRGQRQPERAAETTLRRRREFKALDDGGVHGRKFT